MKESFLIVGLGNPGKKYQLTRHNLGFLAVQNLAKKFKADFQRSPLTSGWVAEIKIKGRKGFLLLPATFMNNSGIAVRKVFLKKEIEIENVLVVCDDFHLDFGQLRIKRKGSDGGHNGLASIIYALNQHQFPRLRMGIGSPPKGQDPADFVLEEFKPKEQEHLETFIPEAADCCRRWIETDINKVMEQYNRRKENGE